MEIKKDNNGNFIVTDGYSITLGNKKDWKGDGLFSYDWEYKGRTGYATFTNHRGVITVIGVNEITKTSAHTIDSTCKDRFIHKVVGIALRNIEKLEGHE